MPSNIAKEFFERLSAVEAKVESLLIWQKWQLGLLAAVLGAIIVKRI